MWNFSKFKKMKKINSSNCNKQKQKLRRKMSHQQPNNTTNIKDTSKPRPSMTQQQVNPIPSTQPTDTYIPSYLVGLVPELESYQKLAEAEKKLDIYLARKKIDIYQSISQWNNSQRLYDTFHHSKKDKIKYLRIFISNIAENQDWQLNPEDNIPTDFNNAESTNKSNSTKPEGSWTLRIEGRLLDEEKAEDSKRVKFSSFIQDIAIDFKKLQNDHKDSNAVGSSGRNDETKNTLTEENSSTSLSMQLDALSNVIDTERLSKMDQKKIIYDVVEWHSDPNNPVEFDGLDVKRNGTRNVDCTITIQPKGFVGTHLQYSKELAAIIGRSVGSLHDAVYALYKYLLINDLLIKDNSKLNNKTNISINNATKNSNSSNGDSSADNNNGEKTMVQLDKFLLPLLSNQSNKQNNANDNRATLDNDGDIDMLRTENTEGTPELKQTMKLTEFLNLINLHIKPMNPIIINYTIKVDQASSYGDLVFDIEVPNTESNSDINKDKNDISKEGIELLSELDEFITKLQPTVDNINKDITVLHLQLNETGTKYQFYSEMSKDPTRMLQEYMLSQSNALKVLSGDEGFNEDTVRRSEFYEENREMLFENIGILLANGRI